MFKQLEPTFMNWKAFEKSLPYLLESCEKPFKLLVLIKNINYPIYKKIIKKHKNALTYDSILNLSKIFWKKS